MSPTPPSTSFEDPSLTLSIAMPSPRRGILTAANLNTLTIHANETPRTKVIRYFNQVEDDPGILKPREPSPIPYSEFHDPLAVTRTFFPRDYQSPILGQKKIPSRKLEYEEPVKMNYAFHSEDSEILIHRTNMQSLVAENMNRMSREENENIYEKRSRNKMIHDPVTGEVNVNAKKSKSKKKLAKFSRPDKFRDFRPLDRFESKLLGQNRLSFDTNCEKRWGGIKDLEFPKLSALGFKRSLPENSGTKKPKDVEELVRGAKKQRMVENDETEISDYFERVLKHDQRNPKHEDPSNDADASHNDKAVVRKENAEAENEIVEFNSSTDALLKQPNTTAMDGNAEPNDKTPSNTSNKKDNCMQTDGQFQVTDISSAEHQNTHQEEPRLNPSHHVQQSNPSDKVSGTIELESIQRVPDSHVSPLEDYANLDPSTSTSSGLQLTNLSTLIQACTAFIPKKPVQLHCAPLSVKLAQYIVPLNTTTQAVTDELVRSPIENHTDISMYPIREDTRYVSGPQVKHIFGLKHQVNTVALSQIPTSDNHLQGNDLSEGIDNFITMAKVPPSSPRRDILIQATKLECKNEKRNSRNLVAESQYGRFSYHDWKPPAIGGYKNIIASEGTAIEDTYMDDFLLDNEFDGPTTESEGEFESRLDEQGSWEDNVCEEPQELDVPNDKEWWKQRMRRF